MAKFSVGDVVELNSGGPTMTVEKIGPVPPPTGMTGNVFKLAENQVKVIWFELSKEVGHGKACDAVFDEKCLKLVRAASAK